MNGAAGQAIDADASTATISGVRYLKAAHGVVSAEAKVIGYLGSIQRELERSSASLVVRAAVTLTDGVDREVGEFMVEMRLQPRRVARIAA